MRSAGPVTAAALAAKGIKADFVPPKYVAESVVQGLLELGVAGKRVLIPRAKEAREVLPEELRAAGAMVDVLPVYETRIAADGAEEFLKRLRAGEVDCVTFASSSTVDNFFSLVPAEALREAKPVLACIGPVTRNSLEKHGFKADIEPEDYTIPAMAAAIAAYFSE